MIYGGASNKQIKRKRLTTQTEIDRVTTQTGQENRKKTDANESKNRARTE